MDSALDDSLSNEYLSMIMDAHRFLAQIMSCKIKTNKIRIINGITNLLTNGTNRKNDNIPLLIIGNYILTDGNNHIRIGSIHSKVGKNHNKTTITT